MMNMYVTLMIILWDVNACLTPWGVTPDYSEDLGDDLPGATSHPIS
jgi:hypothetical protein